MVVLTSSCLHYSESLVFHFHICFVYLCYFNFNYLKFSTTEFLAQTSEYTYLLKILNRYSTMCFFASPADMLSSVLIELHLPYVKAASGRVHGGIRNCSLLFMLPPSLEQLLYGRCFRIVGLKYPS